jgi:hypothetical protein
MTTVPTRIGHQMKNFDFVDQAWSAERDSVFKGSSAEQFTAGALRGKELPHARNQLLSHCSIQQPMNKATQDSKKRMYAISKKPYWPESSYLVRITFRMKEMEWRKSDGQFKAEY